MLLLDTTEINFISELRPDIVNWFRNNYSDQKSILNSKIIDIDYESIKSCINDFKKYCFPEYGDGNDAKLIYPYYIKDNRIAVYIISGDSWTECFRLTLLGNKLQIELIYLIVD